MKLHQFSCDVCGRVKGEANHWFLGYHHPAASIIHLSKWNDGIERDGDDGHIAHLCGLECVNKWVQQQLTKGETHA